MLDRGDEITAVTLSEARAYRKIGRPAGIAKSGTGAQSTGSFWSTGYRKRASFDTSMTYSSSNHSNSTRRVPDGMEPRRFRLARRCPPSVAGGSSWACASDASARDLVW